MASRCLAFALLALLSACGQPGARLPALPGDAVVLAFGDSLTFGTGASPGEDYPSRLSARISRKVVNAGIPGETSGEGRERLPAVLDEVKPQLVLLCLGGNDMLRHQSRDAMHQNLAAMVAEIRSRGMSVMLLAVPEPSLIGLSAEPGYAALAKAQKLALEEDALSDIIGSRSLRADQFHPNAQGYARLAEAVDKALHRAGAI